MVHYFVFRAHCSLSLTFLNFREIQLVNLNCYSTNVRILQVQLTVMSNRSNLRRPNPQKATLEVVLESAVNISRKFLFISPAKKAIFHIFLITILSIYSLYSPLPETYLSQVRLL